MKIKAPILVVIFLCTIAVLGVKNFVILSQTEDSNQIKDVPSLVAAVTKGNNGDRVLVGPGTFELQEPLIPKPGMSIVGMGEGQTTITAVSRWQPSVDDLPKVEEPTAYLFRLEGIPDVTISNMKLTGKNLHGAIYAKDADGLELHHLHLEDFLWSSVRTFSTDNFKVHDNVFVDAGGRYGVTTGAALYMNWTKDSEFWHNQIYSSADNLKNFFGFKGRKGTNLRFHHNYVQVNFSLEFPFENDRGIEIDHNSFQGTVSIPKHAGGSVVEGNLTYHIHHNWFKSSYSLEWARNSVEIDHNFFDFATDDDQGNLIANFGKAASPGYTLFHDNLIRNPGRGIFWTKGIYNQFYFYNNHVKANTKTRTNGFFGLNPSSDFNTIEIKNNIIENVAGNPRPLMRNVESYAAIIENNTFENISDTSAYTNSDTGAPRGPQNPLYFEVGAYGEHTVNNWNVIQTEK